VTAEITIRPARPSDASDIALLINVATHGGIARGWAAEDEAGESYDPIEIGRLEVLRDDETFNWRNATMADAPAGEVAGMLLGYREPQKGRPVPPDTAPFMVPLLELEAAAEGTWFISMLGVHIPWRGRGVGSRLLEAADGKRRATAAGGLSLIVEDVNADARRLYERHGFSVRTSRPMARFPGSTAPGRDWLLMVKD
jgi:ribosomal protein S18 acetylase RimI-like enzyme